MNDLQLINKHLQRNNLIRAGFDDTKRFSKESIKGFEKEIDGFNYQKMIDEIGHWDLIESGRDKLNPNECYHVVFLVKYDKHVILRGYYSSYDSNDYDGSEWEWCEPEIVEIKSWKNV